MQYPNPNLLKRSNIQIRIRIKRVAVIVSDWYPQDNCRIWIASVLEYQIICVQNRSKLFQKYIKVTYQISMINICFRDNTNILKYQISKFILIIKKKKKIPIQ